MRNVGRDAASPEERPMTPRGLIPRFLTGAALSLSAVIAVPFAGATVARASVQQAPSYQTLNELLNAATVSEGGRTLIAYAALRQDNGRIVRAVLEDLAAMSPSSMQGNEAAAYWLNLHNLAVVAAIVAEDVGNSLREERGTGPAPGAFWTTPRVTVGGENLSIAELEEKALSLVDTSDVLYGLYQGAEGGPALPRRAFEGASLEEELAKLGRRYVNGRRTVRARRSTVRVPEVYTWYSDRLFAGDDGQLIAHLSAHAKPDLKDDLADVSEVKTIRFDYGLDAYVPRATGAEAPRRGPARPGGGLGS